MAKILKIVPIACLSSSFYLAIAAAEQYSTVTVYAGNLAGLFRRDLPDFAVVRDRMHAYMNTNLNIT
jgi:hypothetical protein